MGGCVAQHSPGPQIPAAAAKAAVGGTAGGATAAAAPPLGQDGFVQASLNAQLQKVLEEHPYLELGKAAQPHPLSRWLGLCRGSLEQGKFESAQEHLRRVQLGLRAEARPIAEAFHRFDVDGSGQLDATEFRYMCAYLGWGEEEADLMDLDGDGKVSLPEFQAFVGHFGGIQQLFEQRRLRGTTSRKDVCHFAGLVVGARVKAHFYIRGQKSKTWQEAQVLAVGVEKKSSDGSGPITLGVQLEFGFGAGVGERRWKARQVVPPSWVVSGVEDASVASALREVGILDEQQAFWSLLLPDSELQAMGRLAGCQRAALSLVRRQAAEHHEEALPSLREHFQRLGYGAMELQAVLGWIQDLAPIVVHVGLDHMGNFLETDEFYRSQFETKTSCGAGDGDEANSTRRQWEHDLFGGVYDDAKPFERCKYGALNVMNDYRGVVTARQYGDSYLVLKDVRLRCTFASEDSGGIEGSRLAVLDKYAHVLDEYEDEELRGLVAIATSAIAPHKEALSAAAASVRLLRGRSEDPTAEWITLGFPKLAQSTGRYYFEVFLYPDCGAPQVGILSTKFKHTPYAFNQEGVGDDAEGWALDALSAALWHGSCARPWPGSLPAKEVTVEVPGQYSWMRTQVQERVLKEEATIGVAVDLEQRALWFSTDGAWGETPAFGAGDLPAELEVYPAISLKGRAAFHFGGRFKYSPPSIPGGGGFQRWPGALPDEVRVDCPHLGNEETLSCYKEVQIHGEVCLKRNVQRLVAASKYREKPKTERSLALRVTGTGLCDGSYQRVGAHCGAPLYRGDSGASIYFDEKASAWCLSETRDLTAWRFCAPAGGSGPALDPPRRGWRARDEDAGVIDASAFEAQLEASGITGDGAKRLMQALTGAGEDGQMLLFRQRGGATLSAEWERLEAPPDTLEAVWRKAVARMQAKLQEETGTSGGEVIESEHPYEATRCSWRREVAFEGALSLTVHFSSKSCTFDQNTRLEILADGLSRNAAGPGARVEVTASDGGKVWGTVVERGAGGLWRVQLDRGKPRLPDHAEAQRCCPEGHVLQLYSTSGGTCDGCGHSVEAEQVMDCRACNWWLCQSCLPQVQDLDELGVPRWPQIGDAVEAQFTTGRWFAATVADITLELDWYSATRKATYTLDWYDTDTRDREKTWDKLRRPSCPSESPVVDHRDLEDLPLYGMLCAAGQDSSAMCYDEPQVASVAYGTLPAQEVTFQDTDGDVSTFVIEPNGLEWRVPGHGSRACRDLDISRTDTPGAFSVTGSFGRAMLRDPEPGPEQLALMVQLFQVATKCGVSVTGNAVAELEVAAAAAPVESASAAPPISSEIAEFGLDLKCPLMPIFVKRFAGVGPAQDRGVKEGWYLDIVATGRRSGGALEELLDGLGGIPASQGLSKLLMAAFRRPQELLSRLNGPVIAATNLEFVFTNSSSTQQVALLPEAYAKYDGSLRVSGEVKAFSSSGSMVKVESFLAPGPAQRAGIRTDWVLDVQKTLDLNPAAAKIATMEAIFGDPDILLAMSDVTLIFKQPSPQKSAKFVCHGPPDLGSLWASRESGSDSIEFAFSSDGDGADSPGARWGFWALVLPQGHATPSPMVVDQLAQRWTEATRRATWVQEPEVQRDDWDEARLRALCAHHGWEFEWMTEDGERRRRVKEVGRLEANDGLAEAAKAAVRAQRDKSEAASRALPDGYAEHAPTATTGSTADTVGAKLRWKKATDGIVGAFGKPPPGSS